MHRGTRTIYAECAFRTPGAASWAIMRGPWSECRPDLSPGAASDHPSKARRRDESHAPAEVLVTGRGKGCEGVQFLPDQALWAPEVPPGGVLDGLEKGLLRGGNGRQNRGAIWCHFHPLRCHFLPFEGGSFPCVVAAKFDTFVAESGRKWGF